MTDGATVTDTATHIFGPQGALTLTVVGQLALALGLGVLMGLERELAGRKHHAHVLAGIRTMAFVSLLGALTILFDPSGVATLVAFGTVGLLVVAGYVVNTLHDPTTGITTPVATLLALVIGAMVMVGTTPVAVGAQTIELPLTQLAVVGAIAVTISLSAKATLEQTLVRITPDEFYATLKFAVIAFVILPFLPDRPLSELITVDNALTEAALSSINLASLWLLVVLISGIGFVGYVLARIVGPSKGIGLSGFLGGLISSTAVMGAMATRSKGAGTYVLPFVVAATVASVTSFARVFVELAVVNRAVLGTILWPLVAMAATGVVGIILLVRREHRAERAGEHLSVHVEHESPFTLRPALKFATLILLIKVLVKVVRVTSGDSPKSTALLYLVAFISGFADADAFALAVASEALDGSIPPADLASSIVLVVTSNMLSKTGIGALFGSRSFRKQATATFATITLVGAIGVVALKLLL